MWNSVGALVTATTDRPARLAVDDSTAARGVTAESRTGESVVPMLLRRQPK